MATIRRKSMKLVEEGSVYDEKHGKINQIHKVQEMAPLHKINKILEFIKECEDKYPMTGKPDKKALYKNGWYDCAYYLRKRVGKV
jgi:hypothetical protein